MGDPEPLETLRGTNIGVHPMAQIAGANAGRLLGIGD